MDFYEGRNVLITGGLGFIGSNLAIELCSRGAHVAVVDSMRPESGAKLLNVEQVKDLLTINVCDVRDVKKMKELVLNQEIIFCLAGQVSHAESMRLPLVDLDVNCRSLVAMMECCRKSNPSIRFVVASTRQVYGKPKCLPVSETHPIQPTDINGINKWAAESYASLFAHVFGMSTICLRLTNTYGPRMDITNRNKGFVNVFVGQALRGQTIQVFGDGQQRRDFNFVSDVVEAFLLAGSHSEISGQSLNLGHTEHYNLNEFLETLTSFVPVRFERIPFPEELQRIDIGDCYCDFSTFSRLTGWCPQIGLREGLERTIAFYKKQNELSNAK